MICLAAARMEVEEQAEGMEQGAEQAETAPAAPFAGFRVCATCLDADMKVRLCLSAASFGAAVDC
jgi:hypothetical protein